MRIRIFQNILKKKKKGASGRKVNLLNFEFLRVDVKCRKNPVNDLLLDSVLKWMNPETEIHKKKKSHELELL